MSRNNGGDPEYWLNVPLREFGGWVAANNEIREDAERNLSGKRRRRRK